MNLKKIAFIICADNSQYYEECVRYIQELHVPEGYCTDILCIQEADSMAQGYNGGMNASDAKYKVYIQQNTFILNRDFLNDMLRIFAGDAKIGMLGVLGTEKLPEDADCRTCWNWGNIVEYDCRTVLDADFYVQDKEADWHEVEAVNGSLIATQYDIPWREDILSGWEFYDVAQSLEMRRAGYKVVVPYQREAWCYQDSVCGNTKEYSASRQQMMSAYPETFCGKLTQADIEKDAKYVKDLEKLATSLKALFAGRHYAQLESIAAEMRPKWLLHADIREIMNVMEIYSLESASISGIHSKWIFADSWEMLCEYYRWIRLVILRMGYGREDERIAELRQMVEEGLISRDAIRKIAAVSLKDTGDVQERLLGKIAEQPLVSVIICVHNSEDVIGDAIESVLNQSYQNLELLLVDDASTDNSRQVILSYEDSRIKPIFLKKNRHVCYTCNVGFQQARGKYVAVMGHDDMWSPDKLEKQVSFLEEHPGYHVCFSWVNIIDEHKHIRNREEQGMYKMFNSDNAKATEWISSLIRYSNRLCAPSACIRRSILEKAGHYRYALLQLQDYDLWLRCLLEGEIYILQERMTLYRKFQQEGRNVSEVSMENTIRFAHEAQWICHWYINNMPFDLFQRAFKKEFQNPEAVTKKQLQCEKALLLKRIGNCFAEADFVELYEDAECREILEREYHLGLTDFYKLNGKPMYFDEYALQILQDVRTQNNLEDTE